MTTYFVTEKDWRVEAETLENALEKFDERSIDSDGVAEVWFAEKKVAFTRYWDRVPGEEETNRSIQRARVRCHHGI